MAKISTNEAAALRDRMLKVHAPNHVCRPDTRLVIEGYPRSSNSFAVDVVAEAAGAALPRHFIAHHTHEVDNLRLADAYGIPKIILIREPGDAILSFHIYSKAPVEACANRYAEFYRQCLTMMDKAAVVHFRDVTTNIGSVVAKINAIGNFGIDETQDFDAIRERALALVRGRASKDDQDLAARQVAAPDARREALKNELRADVQSYLASRSELNEIYEKILAAGNLPS